MDTFSSREVPVFTDTNLGTHIAISVSPDITAADLKRKLVKAHFLCFPSVGKIQIHALMVTRKSRLYHIPDSFPLKYAFLGLERTWFICVDVALQSDLNPPSFVNFCRDHLCDPNVNEPLSSNPRKQSKHSNGNLNTDKNLLERQLWGQERMIETIPSHMNIASSCAVCATNIEVKRDKIDEMNYLSRKDPTTNNMEYSIVTLEKQNCEKCNDVIIHKEKMTSSLINQTGSIDSSEIGPTAGIITRYFSEFDEVNSRNIVQCPNSQLWKPWMCSSLQQKCKEKLCRDNSTGFESMINAKPNVLKENFLDSLLCSLGSSSRQKTPDYGLVNDNQGCEYLHEKCCEPNHTESCAAIVTPYRTSHFSETGTKSVKTTKGKFGKTEVGKRLVVAADKLGISNKQKSKFSLCRSSEKNASPFNDISPVRRMIFDLSEDDG